jgi:toxin-antitoxin system PIN domain toxin
MNVLDVNVLMALYRPSHVHHGAATRWFDESLTKGEPFTVPDVVWAGFLRLVSNRRVMPAPATFAEAWDFVTAVREQGTYLQFAPSPRTLTEFAHLGMNTNASANLVTDAYIAACAATLGGTVVTFDRDFRKFDGVRILEPA